MTALNAATQKPTDFIEGKNYPSPVTHVVGLGYYDGVTDGILKTCDGSAYRFEMPDEDFQFGVPDARTFQLSPLPAGVFDDVVGLLTHYFTPRWPCWVPAWTFPSKDAERAVDEQLGQWLATARQPAWIVAASDLTAWVSVQKTGCEVG